MKKMRIVLLSSAICYATLCVAQSAAVVEDFKPSTTNQPGKQYPQVNSECRVRASLQATESSGCQNVVAQGWILRTGAGRVPQVFSLVIL